MAAHAAVPARRYRSRSWALPLALGVVYGFYVAFLRRGEGGLTGGQVVLGVVAGLVLAALALVLGRMQHALSREVRAGAYATLCGVAMGFLHSQGGESVLKSSGIGVTLAAAMFAVTFYVFYTRE